jgi:hypothetical protein
MTSGEITTALREILNLNFTEQKAILANLGLDELVALSTLPSLDPRKREYDDFNERWDEWFKSTPTWMHGK